MIKNTNKHLEKGLAYLNYWLTLLSFWAMSLHGYEKIVSPLLFVEWMPVEIRVLRGIIFTLVNQYGIYHLIVPILAIQACLAMTRQKNNQIYRWGVIGYIESVFKNISDISQTDMVKAISCMSLACIMMPAPFQWILCQSYPWLYTSIIEIGGLLSNTYIIAKTWKKDSMEEQELFAWAITSLVMIVGNGKLMGLSVLNLNSYLAIDKHKEFALLCSYQLYKNKQAPEDEENVITTQDTKVAKHQTVKTEVSNKEHIDVERQGHEQTNREQHAQI